MQQDFDVDAYISGYTGNTRLNRLLFIARTAPSLAVPALKYGIKLLLCLPFVDG